MTHEEKGTAMEAVLQPVFERGFDGIDAERRRERGFAPDAAADLQNASRSRQPSPQQNVQSRYICPPRYRTASCSACVS